MTIKIIQNLFEVSIYCKTDKYLNAYFVAVSDLKPMNMDKVERNENI